MAARALLAKGSKGSGPLGSGFLGVRTESTTLSPRESPSAILNADRGVIKPPQAARLMVGLGKSDRRTVTGCPLRGRARPNLIG